MAVTTDDCGAVMLRFDNGCERLSVGLADHRSRKNCLRFEVAGARQSFAWNSETPNELWIGHRDTANELMIRDPALLSPHARAVANYPGGHNEGFPDTFKQLFPQLLRLHRCRRFHRTPPFPTFADGHREVLLCEAVLRSAREGRWVEVGTS